MDLKSLKEGRWLHIALNQTGKNPKLYIWNVDSYFAQYNWAFSQKEITYCYK